MNRNTILNLFCLGGFLLFCDLSQAATYYVDSQLGNDAWTGQAAEPATAPSTSGPWQSLSKVSATVMQPGDTLFLRCGRVWSESLKIQGSGSATQPVSVSSYPQPCATRPLISGVRKIPDHAWQRYSGNIYRASSAWNHIANGTFANGKGDWFVWSSGGDSQLTWLTNCTATNSPCAVLTSGASGSNGIISSKSFALDGGKRYRVRYSVKAPAGIAMKVYVRRGGPTYEATGYRKDFSGTASWQQFTAEFTAPVSLQNARFDLELIPGKYSAYLSDVTVEQVDPIQPGQVFANDSILQLAHHPNAGFEASNIPSIYAHTGATSDTVVIDTSPRSTYLVTGNDLILPNGAALTSGLGIVIRPNPWTLDERRITSIVGNKLAIDTPSTYPIPSGLGYYLTGALWMLDSPGEWFFDPSTNNLYVWMPDGVAPGSRLSVGAPNTGIDLSQLSYVQVSGLAVSGVEIGIDLRKSAQVTLSDMDISDIRTYGVYANGASFPLISTTSISRTGNDAIYAPNSSNAAIRDCNVTESAVRVSNGKIASLPRAATAAILVGKNAIISGNLIQYSGYNGIRGLDDVVIENNVVIGSCQTLNDCGGIYVSSDSPRAIIRNNIVRALYGNIDGLPANWRYHAVGIYLDDHSNGMTISGNTVSEATFGIHVHDAYNNLIDGNNLFGNRNHQIWIQEQRAQLNPAGDIVNNTISGNKLFATDGNLQLMQESDVQPIENFGLFSGNRFSALIASSVIGEIWPNGNKAYTVNQWQTITDTTGHLKGDATATEVRPTGYAATLVTGINLVPNGALTSGLTGWTYWSLVAPQPKMTLETCTIGRCVHLLSGGSASLLTSPNFSVVQGQSYRVTFDAKTSADGQTVAPVVRRGGPAPLYERLMAATQSFTGSTVWKRYSFTFKATKTVNANDPFTNELGARVDFEQNMPGANLWVANLEMVPLQDTSVTLRSHLISNESRIFDSFECPELNTADAAICSDYVDFDTEDAVAWPMSLAPSAAQIVFTRAAALLDNDSDGIANSQDKCPNTPVGEVANAVGCGIAQPPL